MKAYESKEPSVRSWPSGIHTQSTRRVFLILALSFTLLDSQRRHTFLKAGFVGSLWTSSASPARTEIQLVPIHSDRVVHDNLIEQPSRWLLFQLLPPVFFPSAFCKKAACLRNKARLVLFFSVYSTAFERPWLFQRDKPCLSYSFP